jgi:DNA-binding response OmpR family regulator
MPHILIVEPNSRVLTAMREILAEVAELGWAGCVEDAVSVASTWPPDLVISDYRLGKDTCTVLAEQLRRAEINVPMVVIASRQDATDRLAAQSAQFEDIIHKPFLPDAFRDRIRRDLQRAGLRRADESGQSAFHGRLEDLSLVDLLQSMDLSAKTCAVQLRSSAGADGSVYLVDGQVRHAQLDDDKGNIVAEGRDAAFKMLGWKTGEFTILFGKAPPRSSIVGSTQALLLDGLRLIDESKLNRP